MSAASATSPAPFVRDAPGVEKVTPEEVATTKAISDQFNQLQELNAKETHHMYRGTHVKTQGCVKGTFKVKEGLPVYLRQGMFKDPKTFDMIMRYSSLTPRILPDTIPAPRAIGMKIFGVKGQKLFHEDNETQDWVANNYPYSELRTTKVTHDLATSIERNWDNFDGLVEELKSRPDAELSLGAGAHYQEHPVAMDQHSQSAYRFGDFVCKFAVFPAGEKQKELKSWRMKPDDQHDIISKSLRDFHLHHTATYRFCVQLLRDLDSQPVEDIGVVWDPVKYPFEEVATLEFEPQDSYLPAFRTWWDDKITLDSWWGLVEHQPLGSTNRTRKVVYAASRKARVAFNKTPLVEPRGLQDVPA